MAQESNRQALVHYNRGCVLQGQQDWEAAIACYDQALALDPRLAAAYSNRGAAFAAMNRCDEAIASLSQAIGLEPDYPEAHFGRAVTLLLKGDLPAGWVDFEWRGRPSLEASEEFFAAAMARRASRRKENPAAVLRARLGRYVAVRQSPHAFSMAVWGGL